MKTVPKFDIAQYVASHANTERSEISKLAGLAGHIDETKNLTDQEVIRLLSQATYKTGISAQQFWHFCDVDDITDIYAGQYSLEQLTAYAKSWARYPETVPEANAQPFPTFEAEAALDKK